MKYLRPKTRGELRDALKKGITCEIVASNQEITDICLKWWLNFSDYTVVKSENKGWCLYVPKDMDQ